ncbi:MAG: DUF3526 domain-containing protein [Planctomycetes bacterium]|nr:DUF3526 domain-containing protein [Planctomycetota bacterium]
MILAIAKREFVDAWRDGRFRLAALLVLALIGASALLARAQNERSRTEREAAARLERENWVNQGEKNSHSAGHYGIHVFKPAAALAPFDRGVEPFVGPVAFLEAHRMNQTAFLPARDGTAMRRFGDLSASLALQVLFPLIIVLLCHGTLAGERERGTLRQLLALGVTPRALVAGKAIGLFACTLLLLAPAAVALAWITADTPAQPGADITTRAVALAALYSGYSGLFVLLSVAASALARSARSALAALLGLWAFNCILAPRLASDLVHAALPATKLAEFDAAVNADLQMGLDGHDSRSEHMQEFTRRTLAEHGKSRIEELPFNFQGLAMLEGERFSSAVWQHHFGRLFDQFERQDRAVARAGIAAPLLAVRHASMAFAGTDLAEHRRFALAAERHRNEFVRVLNEDLMRNAPPGDHRYTAGRELWESLPEFRLAPSGFGDAWSTAREGALVLAGWLVAALALLLVVPARLRGADA